MAKNYVGKNTLTYLITLVKNALAGKVDTADIVNSLDSTESDKVLSAAQGKVLAEQIAASGGGDMLASRYDTDNDGKVNSAVEADHAVDAGHADSADEATHAASATTADDASKLGGQEPSYYAKAGDIETYVTGQKGVASGLCPLEANSKINSIYLPSYVDDVVEGYLHEGFFYEDEAHDNLIQGEKGKIYVDLSTDISYRYSGSAYVAITSSDMVEIQNDEVDQIWSAST